MLVSKAIMNTNTLTSTFCHKSNRVRFSLTYLLSVATDFWDDSGDRLCGVWISSDGVAVRHSVRRAKLLTRSRVIIKAKQSNAMQNRAQAKAEAYRRRWGCTVSKLNYARNLAQLVLRKIIKIVATRCKSLRLKCTKFDFGWGSAPDPAGGASY